MMIQFPVRVWQGDLSNPDQNFWTKIWLKTTLLPWDTEMRWLACRCLWFSGALALWPWGFDPSPTGVGMLLSSRCDDPGLLCLCPGGVSDRGVIAACHPHYQVHVVINTHTHQKNIVGLFIHVLSFQVLFVSCMCLETCCTFPLELCPFILIFSFIALVKKLQMNS